MTLIGLRHSAIMLFLEAGHGGGHTLDHLNQAGHIPGKCSDMGGEFTAGEARPAAWVVLLLQGYAHRMHPSGAVQAPHHLLSGMVASMEAAVSTEFAPPHRALRVLIGCADSRGRYHTRLALVVRGITHVGSLDW